MNSQNNGDDFDKANSSYSTEPNKPLKADDEKDIFELLGAANIPEDEKGELLAKMLDLVQGRTLLAVRDKMTEEQKKKLEEVVESGTTEDLELFLKDSVPEYPQIYLDEAAKLRQKLLINLSK